MVLLDIGIWYLSFIPPTRLLQIRFKLIIINILRIFYLLIVSENSFQKQVNYGLY